MNLYETIRAIRDMAAIDDVPAHRYGQRLRQIRAAANDAMTEIDNGHGNNENTWGGRDNYTIAPDAPIAARAGQPLPALAIAARRYVATKNKQRAGQ